MFARGPRALQAGFCLCSGRPLHICPRAGQIDASSPGVEHGGQVVMLFPLPLSFNHDRNNDQVGWAFQTATYPS